MTDPVRRVGGPLDPDDFFTLLLADATPAARPALDPRPSARWQRWWRAQHAALGSHRAGQIAREQGFVLTPAEARAAGMSPADLRREVARGTWCAAAYGALSPLPRPTPTDGDEPWGVLPAGRRRHALAATGAALTRPGQVVSGRSAAVLHGLPTLAVPAAAEVTSDRTTTRGRRGRSLVRSADLSPSAVTSWFGAPVTTVARTIVDVARQDRREGLMVADAALHDGLVEPDELAAALATAQGWPGVRAARDVLALADPLAESPLESVVRLALHDDGFPPPQLQVPIAGYRVDFLWPEAMVILEADGRVKYSREEWWLEKKREKRREKALTRLGYRIARVVWADALQDWQPTREELRVLLAWSPR